MSANSPAEVAAQYATDQHLQTRIQTHRRYSVGPDLETLVDEMLALTGDEALLDVGTGPGHFPARVKAALHRGQVIGADLSAGMVRQAQASFPDVTYVQASADALPFQDAQFDVLTARHMLYHVPSVPAALSEFGRVLRPGGRFLALTNTAGYMAELWDAVAEAAEFEALLVPLAGSRASFADAFSEVNGEQWVQEAFGNAKVRIRADALVFPDPEPPLAYLASTFAWQHLSSPERQVAERALRTVLDSRFRHGPWHVSKRGAFISAVRED
jgi:SAM-dependent methyltransferase